MKQNKGKQPPVKVGDEVTLHITATGLKGDGIGKVMGYTIFVQNAAQGTTAKVRIKKCLPKFGFGELIA